MAVAELERVRWIGGDVCEVEEVRSHGMLLCILLGPSMQWAFIVRVIGGHQMVFGQKMRR